MATPRGRFRTPYHGDRGEILPDDPGRRIFDAAPEQKALVVP